jgi:hypothetical protein
MKDISHARAGSAALRTIDILSPSLCIIRGDTRRCRGGFSERIREDPTPVIAALAPIRRSHLWTPLTHRPVGSSPRVCWARRASSRRRPAVARLRVLFCRFGFSLKLFPAGLWNSQSYSPLLSVRKLEIIPVAEQGAFLLALGTVRRVGQTLRKPFRGNQIFAESRMSRTRAAKSVRVNGLLINSTPLSSRP